MTDEIDKPAKIINDSAVPENSPQDPPRNALKHGAFSKALLLPWEDAAEFEALHQQLRDEWQPEGPLEEDTVATYLDCLWRKRRVRQKRQIDTLAAINKPNTICLQQPIPFFEEDIDRIKSSLLQKFKSRTEKGDLAAQLLGFSSSLYGKQDYEQVAFSIRWLGGESAAYLQREVPQENYANSSEWIRDLKHHVDTILLPKARAEHDPDSLFLAKAAEFLTEDRILEDIALEERLDARMDRAIRRFAQLKALKQVAGIKRPSASRPENSARLLQAPSTTPKIE